jgi:hypothetical protein
MTDPEDDTDQPAPDENGASGEPVGPTPFWRSSAFAVVAALIALIGMVWRCA